MFRYIFMLTLMSTKMMMLGTKSITRLQSGDEFDAICNTCHLYNAQCSNGFLFSCCTKCKCENQATIFGDMCYADLSHSQFSCKFFLQDSQWYGFPTNTLKMNGHTTLGYIVYDRDWNQRRFSSCYMSRHSSYWDTKEWLDLHTEGRTQQDFFLDNSGNGVKLQFVGDNTQRLLYLGLLMKFSMECCHDNNCITSCVAIKISGKRIYDDSPSSTLATTKFARSTTIVPNTTITTTKTSKSTPKTTRSIPVIDHVIDHVHVYRKPLIAVGVTAFFLTAFCCVFMFSHWKRRKPKSGNKGSPHTGYQTYALSPRNQPTAEDTYEHIHSPSYSDLNELISRYDHTSNDNVYKSKIQDDDVLPLLRNETRPLREINRLTRPLSETSRSTTRTRSPSESQDTSLYSPFAATIS